MKGYLYILLAVLGTTCGQVFIKLASRKITSFSLGAVFLNSYLYLAFAFIATVPFLVNLALDSFPLSTLFAFTGLQYVTVAVAAALFLQEEITSKMAVGMVFIVVGVILYHQ